MTKSGGGEGRQGRAALSLLAAAVLLAMAPWFAAAASASWLANQHGLETSHVGWLTGAVQLGFVLGTLVAAFLNLVDLIPARWLFGVSALLAAGINLLTLGAGDLTTVLMSRGLTGFFLAGVYPPAMKMAATWFSRSRGMAIGVVVGALTLGKALPFLFLDGTAWGDGMTGASGQAIRWTSLAGLVGGLLVLGFWRVGPYPFPHRPFALGRVGEVVRHRPTRLAIGGYVGHMWELYTMWALIGLFFQFHLGELGRTDASIEGLAAVLTFAVIGAGGLGSVFAGIWADRVGRTRIAAGAMAVSGLCALGIGWMGSLPIWVVVTVALVWGIAIVADSAQFSALVTEIAPPHTVGTAVTLQTSIGFLVTVVSIAVGTGVADRWGWGPAFSLLAIGPALGIAAMWRLHKLVTSGPEG